MNVPDEVYMKEVVDPVFRPIINEVVKTMPLDMPKFLRRYVRGKKYVVLDYKTEYQTKVLIPIFDSLVKQCLADRPTHPLQWMMKVLEQDGDVPWGSGVTDFNYNRLSVVTKIDRHSVVGSKRFSVATMIPSDFSTPVKQPPVQTPTPSAQKPAQLMPQTPSSRRIMLSEIPEEHEYSSPRAAPPLFHGKQPFVQVNTTDSRSLDQAPGGVVSTNDAASVAPPATVLAKSTETEVVMSFAFKKRAPSLRLGRSATNPGNREVCGDNADDSTQFPQPARISCSSTQSDVPSHNAPSVEVGCAPCVFPAQGGHGSPLRSSVRSRTSCGLSQMAQGCDPSRPYSDSVHPRLSACSEASHAHRLTLGSEASLSQSSMQTCAYPHSQARGSIGSKESNPQVSEKQYTAERTSSTASVEQDDAHEERVCYQFAHSPGDARARDQRQPSPSDARFSMQSSAATRPTMQSETAIGPVVGQGAKAGPSRPSETCLPKLTSWPYDAPQCTVPHDTGHPTREYLESNHRAAGSLLLARIDTDDASAMRSPRQSDCNSCSVDAPNDDGRVTPHSTRGLPTDVDRRDDVAATAAQNRRNLSVEISGEFCSETPHTIATPVRASLFRVSRGKVSDTGSSACNKDMKVGQSTNASHSTPKPDPIPIVRHEIPTSVERELTTNAATRDFYYDECAVTQNMRKSSSVLLEHHGVCDDYRNAPPLTASLRPTPPFSRDYIQSDIESVTLAAPRQSLSTSRNQESVDWNLMDAKHGWVAPSPDDWRDSVRPNRAYSHEPDEDEDDVPQATHDATRPSNFPRFGGRRRIFNRIASVQKSSQADSSERDDVGARPTAQRRGFSRGMSFLKSSQADSADCDDPGTRPSTQRPDIDRGVYIHAASQADCSDWEDQSPRSVRQRRGLSPDVPFRKVSREDSSEWDDAEPLPTIENDLHHSDHDSYESSSHVTRQKQASRDTHPWNARELSDQHTTAAYSSPDSAIPRLEDFLGQ